MHGAQAILVTLNTIFIGNLIKRLNTEIAEIDHYTSQILASLSVGQSLSPDRLVLDNEVERSFEDQFLQEFNETFAKERSPCVKGPDGKGGCINISPLINDVTSGLKLDGIVGQTSNDLGKFSDAIGGKSKLDKNAVKLGQKIAAAKGPLEKIKSRLMKDYNKERAKQGKAPYEFEKLTANLLQTIKDKFFEAVGKDAKASIANVGTKKERIKDAVKQAKKKTVAAKKDSVGKTTTAPGFEFNFQQEKKSKDGIFTDDTIKEANVDKYSLSGADINKGAGKNIFKVISIRYFKSAYPVLVEETK